MKDIQDKLHLLLAQLDELQDRVEGKTAERENEYVNRYNMALREYLNATGYTEEFSKEYLERIQAELRQEGKLLAQLQGPSQVKKVDGVWQLYKPTPEFRIIN